MAKQNKQSKKQKEEDRSGLFIPAGIFLGLGIGLLFREPGVGVLIGLGVGFLLMALFKNLAKN